MKNLKKSINFIEQRNKVCHESWPEAYISFFVNDPVIESGKKKRTKRNQHKWAIELCWCALLFVLKCFSFSSLQRLNILNREDARTLFIQVRSRVPMCMSTSADSTCIDWADRRLYIFNSYIYKIQFFFKQKCLNK